MILVGERLAEVARRADRRGATGRAHRRQAGLGAAPGRRARRDRGRRAARPAARRPPGHRPGRARRGGQAWGVGSLPAEPGPGHRRRSSPPRRPASSMRSSSPASTPLTCPTRPRRSMRWRPPGSWSAWSCGPARSPTGPTWCSRSPRSPRRPGTFLNWEGRPGRSARPSRSQPSSPTCRCSARSPTRWTSISGCRPPLRPAPSSRRSRRARRPQSGQAQPGPAVPQAAVSGQISQLGRSHPGPGAAILATWHQLLDAGRLRTASATWPDGARPVAVMSAATAAEAGAADGDKVTVATDRGAITVPVRDRRHARPGRLAARQLGRLRGAQRARRGPRQPGDGEEGGMTAMTSAAQPRAIAAADPTLSSFGHDPWWLIAAQGARRSSCSCGHDAARRSGPSAG